METSIPQAYLLGSIASPEEIAQAITALSITPLYFAIVSDMKDVPLAVQFGVEVLKVPSEDEAIEFALFTFAQQEMPSLVISSTAGLTAVYEGGKRERVHVG